MIDVFSVVSTIPLLICRLRALLQFTLVSRLTSKNGNEYHINDTDGDKYRRQTLSNYDIAATRHSHHFSGRYPFPIHITEPRVHSLECFS